MKSFLSGGVRIAYMDEPPTQEPDDARTPMLLIHGFASNHTVNWVNTLWVKSLRAAGRRVIALDNRGHGRSDKLYDPADYDTRLMAQDAVNLLDHLELPQAVVFGYSMGARITAFLARDHAARAQAIILGGLGYKLIDGVGLPRGIADAMDAPALESLTDPMQRMFRAFAEQTGSDLRALAACIRGSRQSLSVGEVRAIACPALVSVGTKDDVAGDGAALGALMPRGEYLEIPGRDHNLAVGDRIHRQGVLSFLAQL